MLHELRETWGRFENAHHLVAFGQPRESMDPDVELFSAWNVEHKWPFVVDDRELKLELVLAQITKHLVGRYDDGLKTFEGKPFERTHDVVFVVDTHFLRFVINYEEAFDPLDPAQKPFLLSLLFHVSLDARSHVACFIGVDLLVQPNIRLSVDLTADVLLHFVHEELSAIEAYRSFKQQYEVFKSKLEVFDEDMIVYKKVHRLMQ